MPLKKVKRKKVKRKKVKRKKVKRKKVKRKKVKRKRKFGKSKPKSFDVRSFAKKYKVPLGVAATMLGAGGVGAGYYYKTRSSKSSKMTGTEERQYSKGEIKKRITEPMSSIIEENQKLKKMLYKVSKKYEKCRDTIQEWYDSSYWDQGGLMGEALNKIKLEDNDLEKKIREIEKEMKQIMTGKYVRFGKRKRKRKFGSTSDKDVYGNTKRDVPKTRNTNVTAPEVTKLLTKYYFPLVSNGFYSQMSSTTFNMLKNLTDEIASIKKLDKSWKEVTGAIVKIMLEREDTLMINIPKPKLKITHGTYAENMNLLVNFILSGKYKTPKNISTKEFQSNVQRISSFLTESLGEIGNKRSLTKDDIQSIFCAGINIKVNEKAKKQAEKIIDKSF